jgi:hypothetical protein
MFTSQVEFEARSRVMVFLPFENLPPLFFNFF